MKMKCQELCQLIEGHGDELAVRLMLNKNPDLQAYLVKNEKFKGWDWSPLHVAVKCDGQGMLKLLIEEFDCFIDAKAEQGPNFKYW